MMLDFYAVRDLYPFPEDMPAESVLLGSMDIREYHRCAELVRPCLAKLGVEASYFSDWIVAPEQQAELLRGLERPEASTKEAQRALDVFTAIVRGAAGLTLLAVCD